MDREKNYCSPPGRHRHECVSCHVVWEHKTVLDENGNPVGLTVAHTCPECGHVSFQPWAPYHGPKPPAYHDPGCKPVPKVDPGEL